MFGGLTLKDCVSLFLLKVTVYLKGAEGMCSEAQPGRYSEGKSVQVLPKRPASVAFVIVPLEVRRIPIEVAAVTKGGQQYSDAIQKKLLVRVGVGWD